MLKGSAAFDLYGIFSIDLPASGSGAADRSWSEPHGGSNSEEIKRVRSVH